MCSCVCCLLTSSSVLWKCSSYNYKVIRLEISEKRLQYGSKKEVVWEDQVGQQLFLCIFFFVCVCFLFFFFLIYLLMYLFRDFKRSSHPLFKNPFHLFQQTCMHATEQSNDKFSTQPVLFAKASAPYNHQIISLHALCWLFQNIQNVSK